MLVLVAAACAANPATTTSTLIPTTVDPPFVSTTSTTAVPVDPAKVLADGLAAIGTNYRFSSQVLVDSQALTSIDGVVDGTAVSAVVVVAGSELAYIRTDEGEWVQEAGADWVELEGEPPVGSPLAGVADATGLTLESGDASDGVIRGELGSTAGEASGVPFSATIQDGVVTEIRYRVDTGGGLAEVVTTFSDFGSAGSVVKPEV